MAKKASSTAARRCIIKNFTLVPFLTCGTICPPPSPSVHEASHYALIAGLPFVTVAMQARKFSITYTRPASPCPRTCRNAAKPVDRREYL
jgi:hypothetical protein